MRVLKNERQVCHWDGAVGPYSPQVFGIEQKWSVSDSRGINAVMDRKSRIAVTTKKLATTFAKKWNRQHHSKHLIKGREYILNDSMIFYDEKENIEVPILSVFRFTKKKGDYYFIERKKLMEIVNGLRKD